MLRGYIATSADGYVAEEDGSYGFLAPFDAVDYGYDAFMAELDELIVGRVTYDQCREMDPWPYAGKIVRVVTSTELADPPEGVSRWTGTLRDYAESMTGKASWVLGGAKLQAAFIAEGLLDRLELFVIPVFLGRGVPLFPHDGPPVGLTLVDTTRYENGVVRLDYRFGTA